MEVKQMNIRGALWTQFESRRNKTVPYLNQISEWQWLDSEQAVALQQERLTSILLHAHKHTPYYRSLLGNAGVITPSGSVDLSRIPHVPAVDKTVIREDMDSMKSDDLSLDDSYDNTSGGSTGESVRFVQDKHYHDWIMAVKSLFDGWTGYEYGRSRVYLWGSMRDMLVGQETARVRFGRWLRNEDYLNAFRMAPDRMREYVSVINRRRPVQMTAYVDSLYDLSRFIEEEGLKVWSPKAILTSAGVLHPHMRETIERVFGCPVHNRYGSREVGDIACECREHNGLHVSLPTHYVEIVRPDGSAAEPGEVGEVLVTSLVNYAMPLIRYRIGDMAALSARKCSCGRRWPMLEQIAGRLTDTFVSPSGDEIHGQYFSFLFYFQDWARKFQVIQEERDYIRALVVPRDPVEDPHRVYADKLAEIAGKMRVAMGDDCRIEFEFVPDIDPSASGKYRYTVSKVDRDRSLVSLAG
jgi:phenylacetate-CoA ligase